MLSSYSNQAMEWRSQTGTKDNGAAIFAAPQMIMGRFEYKMRLIRKLNGDEVMSEARVFTTAIVKQGDRLTYDGREWPVLAVTRNVGLGGGEIGREVSL